MDLNQISASLENIINASGLIQFVFDGEGRGIVQLSDWISLLIILFVSSKITLQNVKIDGA